MFARARAPAATLKCGQAAAVSGGLVAWKAGALPAQQQSPMNSTSQSVATSKRLLLCRVLSTGAFGKGIQACFSIIQQGPDGLELWLGVALGSETDTPGCTAETTAKLAASWR